MLSIILSPSSQIIKRNALELSLMFNVITHIHAMKCTLASKQMVSQLVLAVCIILIFIQMSLCDNVYQES